MANLQRNMIELIKNPEEVREGGEPEMEKFWTPAYIPFSKVREALQIAKELDEENDELEGMEKLSSFIVDVYNNQFTKDELFERIHAPDALKTMQENLMFITQGQQNESTKAFLNKKK